MEIYLIRHGETDANIKGVGASADLNEQGIKQSELVRDYCKDIDFDCIMTSNKERAIKTAQIFAEHHKDTEFLIREDLREIYGPLVGGKSYNEPEGTEEKDRERIEKFWKEIQKSNYKKLAIIGHGHFIRYLVGKTLNLQKEHNNKVVIDNCSLTRIQLVNGTPFLISCNENKHVPSTGRPLYLNLYSNN